MKKLAFLSVILLLACSVNAQLSFGVKAGANISKFVGGDFQGIDVKSYTSFHAGVLAHWKFGNLVLQPEALFSSQGAKLKRSGGGSDTTIKLNYVNIPVMLQYETTGGFYGEAGPQFGFKISEDHPGSEDVAKSTDFAVGVGLGYHKTGIGFGARYLFGLTKVSETTSGNYNPNFKNGVLQVSVFYTFFNKKNKK